MYIRDYQESDREILKDLTLRAWEPVFEGLEESMDPEIYKIFVPDWQAEQMRSLNTVCDDPAIHVIVAEADNKLLGYAAMSFHPEDYLGQIYMIGVDPRHQQQGIGTALMEAGLKIIREAGFSLAMIETGGDPGHAAARAAYERMGFQKYEVARYLKVI